MHARNFIVVYVGLYEKQLGLQGACLWCDIHVDELLDTHRFNQTSEE